MLVTHKSSISTIKDKILPASNNQTKDTINSQQEPISHKSKLNLANLSNTCLTKQIGNCLFNIEELPNTFISKEDKYFPKAKASSSFYNKNKLLISHSLKVADSQYHPPTKHQSNPVMVKNQLKGILRAKSTFIRKNKLQEYYINLDDQGNRIRIIVEEDKVPRIATDSNSSLKKEIEKTLKPKHTKKMKIQAIHKKKGSITIKRDCFQSYSYAFKSHFMKIHTDESITNDQDEPRKTFSFEKEQKYSIGSLLYKKSEAKQSNLFFKETSKNFNQLSVLDLSNKLIKGRSFETQEYQSKPQLKEKNKLDLQDIDINLQRNMNPRRFNQRKHRVKSQVQDFELMPWANKDDDKENQLFF